MNNTMTAVTLVLCIAIFLEMLLLLARQGNHHRGMLDLARQHRQGIHYLTQRLAALERAVTTSTPSPSQASQPKKEEETDA